MKHAHLEQNGVKSTSGYYNVSADAAFCYLCLTAELETKFKASTKREVTFISKEYTNWKDACEAL